MTPLTPVGQILLALALLAVLVMQRRWAPVPILLLTCYVPLSQGVMLGPFNFFSIRLLILATLGRILLRREHREIVRSPLDRVMAAWSVWALAASAFHSDPAATLTYNGGLVFNTAGIYIILRVFCRNLEDAVFLCRVVAWLLVPVALAMAYEQLSTTNLFSFLGGVPVTPEIREGRARAQGPFAHSILAGTVGAVLLPLCLALWNRHRGSALVGAFASVVMVFASASSGPLMSAMLAITGLFMWRMRRYMRAIRWTAATVYLLLAALMNSPPYYLIARIDLSGGSTGWHRARLIESAFEHLGEWWFAGTDYTRHWMPTGVPWNPNHTDLTNHYLVMGVQGGLPLMFFFILLLAKGFSIVGQSVQETQKAQPERAFFCWALGASLFAHAATCISATYFDQSVVFLYVTLAAIAGVGASLAVNTAPKRPATQRRGIREQSRATRDHARQRESVCSTLSVGSESARETAQGNLAMHASPSAHGSSDKDPQAMRQRSQKAGPERTQIGQGSAKAFTHAVRPRR
jgi:hypothetical protein